MTKVLAQRAWFSFNVNQHDGTGMDGFNGIEWRLAGEGIDTLDEAITILQRGTIGAEFFNLPPSIQLDYGDIGEDLQDVGIRNLQQLKTAFISIYGSVFRPDVYNDVGD